MTRIPIALQLYSVRKDCEADFPATLKAVAAMGYEGVDFAGYYGYEAAAIRKMLDDLGLKVAGCHTGLNTLLGDELKKTIEFNHILGNKFLIVPWIPEERRQTRDGWLQTAELFNEIAAQLKPEGWSPAITTTTSNLRRWTAKSSGTSSPATPSRRGDAA
jgi:sugar phosphate isomerase/epimerase